MRRNLSFHPNIKHDCFIIAPEIILVSDFDEESFKKFQVDFSKAVDSQQSIIPILIDSYGGNVHSALGMISILETSPVPVATVVVSKAMSAGVILFSCGTKGMRYISPRAHLMIHQVSMDEEDAKVADVKVSLDHTEDLNKEIFDILDVQCNKKRGYFSKQVEARSNADWYINHSEAIRLGLADKCGVPSLHISVQQKIELK